LAPLNAIAPAIGTLADAAHIAGVALWVGGLVTILAARSFLREPTSVPLARIVLGRFSAMAFYCVGLVLIGGLVLALLLVGSWDALFSSGYGWVVLAKVSLFIPMIAFGAYNRYRLIPRAAETGEPSAAFRQLTWNVRNETAIGATVLVLAAILASLTPAVSVFAGSTEFTLNDTVSGIHIQMIIDPPPATANISYTVQFLLTWASNGSAYNFGKNTSVITFRSETNVLLPPQTLPLDGPHGDHFFITTLAMSQPGTWSIRANDHGISIAPPSAQLACQQFLSSFVSAISPKESLKRRNILLENAEGTECAVLSQLPGCGQIVAGHRSIASDKLPGSDIRKLLWTERR